MKIHHTLILLILATSSLVDAKTKEETIAKYLEVSNAKQNHVTLIKRIEEEACKIHELNQAPTNAVMDIVREHLSWENWEPVFTSLLDETYTQDELEILIKYYESMTPELIRVLDKQQGMNVKIARINRERWEVIRAQINQLVQDPPANDKAETGTKK